MSGVLPASAAPSPSPRDAGRGGWVVVITFAVVVAVTQILWLTFAAIDTDVARDYHVSRDAVGWFANVYPLMYVLIALPAGLALDRWFRGTLMLGACLAALGALLRLVEPNFAWSMVGQVLGAIAQPLILNALTKVATGYLPPGRRTAGIALGSAAQFLGAIVALVLGPTLEARHGVQFLLVVEAAIACAAVGALALGLRRPPAHAGPAAGAGLAELRAAWSVRIVKVLAGLMFVGVGVFVAISTYLQPILHHDRISATAAGLMLAAMLVAGIAGCAITPPLVERRRAERRYLATAVGAVAVGMGVLAIVHHVTAADFAVIAVIGFFLLAALPVILDIIERRMGDAGGVATGILLLCGNAGGLLVAVALGLVTGTPAIAFLLLALVAVCGLPFAGRVVGISTPAAAATTATDPTRAGA